MRTKNAYQIIVSSLREKERDRINWKTACYSKISIEIKKLVYKHPAENPKHLNKVNLYLWLFNEVD